MRVKVKTTTDIAFKSSVKCPENGHRQLQPRPISWVHFDLGVKNASVTQNVQENILCQLTISLG